MVAFIVFYTNCSVVLTFFLDQKRNSRIYDISPCCKVLSKDKGKKGIIQEQKFVSIVFKLIKIFDALQVINEQKC